MSSKKKKKRIRSILKYIELIILGSYIMFAPEMNVLSVVVLHNRHGFRTSETNCLWNYLLCFYTLNFNSHCVLDTKPFQNAGWPTLNNAPPRLLCRHWLRCVSRHRVRVSILHEKSVFAVCLSPFTALSSRLFHFSFHRFIEWYNKTH